MTKKKVKKISNIQKRVQKFEREMIKDVDDAQKWIYARKKFFIKLAWVIGFVVLLLILSHLFLRVKVV